MFTKTYQDNLRKLRAEQAKQEKIEPLPSVDPFKDNVYDISDLDVEPIDSSMIYRKNFAKLKHAYNVEVPETKQKLKGDNKFTDVEAILPALISDCPEIDSDFLTGYYLIRQHMALPYVLTSFHAGISSDSLTKGIYYALLKREKKTKWQMLGCDTNQKSEYKNIMYNGIKKPCDIYDPNTIASVNIQLGEVIDLASINLYTCDIRSKSTREVLRQLLLIRDFLTPDAYILLRLPPDWTNCYTSMSTLLLFIVSHYKSVKLIKTPWGATHKIYLLIQSRKLNINTKVYLALNAYINELTDAPNIPLISQSYFNINDQASIMKKINDAYCSIRVNDMADTITKEEATQLYTSIL
jgi:hypothetical protein